MAKLTLYDAPMRQVDAYGRRVKPASYDALAYDKVSERPSTGGLTQSLLVERYTTPKAKLPTKPSNGKLVLDYYRESFGRELVKKVDVLYRPHAKQAYLEANSHENIMLPAAANYLCPKCGMTLTCTCDKKLDVTQAQYKAFDEDKPKKKVIRLSGFSTDPWSATNRLADRLLSRIPSALYWIVESEL